MNEPGRAAGRILLVLDAGGAVVAAAYATFGLRSALRADRQGQEAFWAAASAVRTWSVVSPLLVSFARSRPSPDLLLAAALVQAGDSALGIWRRNVPMAVASALMSLAHLATARSLRNETPRISTTRRWSL